MIKVESYGSLDGFCRPQVSPMIVVILSCCVHCNVSSSSVDVPYPTA